MVLNKTASPGNREAPKHFKHNTETREKMVGEKEQRIPRPEWQAVRGFCARYPWPTESALRSMISRAKKLGLTKAFLRINRRVLVDVDCFFNTLRRRSE